MAADNTHETQSAPVEQPQPAAQPQNIQYVVTQRSLTGLGGWLIFWLIVFSLGGLGEISNFATALVSLDGATKVTQLIFSPILAVGFIGSVVLIALQKALGKWAAIATIGVSALYSTVAIIVSAVDTQADSQMMPGIVTGIVAAWVFAGLISLYFLVSKRVKSTLVK